MRRARSTAGPALVGVIVGLLAALVQPSFANNFFGGANHWSDGNQPRAYASVEDYTPSGWPVLAATSEWATEPNIDIYYGYQSCNTGHCMDVITVNSPAPCTSYAGERVESFSNGHLAQSTYLQFNDACENSQWTNRDRRAVACHELGHAWGLAHAQTDPDNTCMVSYLPISGLHEHPREHDFTTMHEDIYNHND